MVWELEGYDTKMREARCREYTTSLRTADLWVRIPRIDFTDSGHAIVFTACEHSGRRRPKIRRMDHADEWMRRLRDGRAGLTSRQWATLVLFDSHGEVNEGMMHEMWPLIKRPCLVVNSLLDKDLIFLGEWWDDAGYELHLTDKGRKAIESV